ncbi:hypothetical protein E2C01_096364 [Portunus trituberculatus]|uniref:Uncharacterized protein n=1 Tax=Portunus trituberculatus TaxID=210409 RepID=A0A5B7K1J4_PORTR|nr:hypothetical protein [Portunus trituberculatus]
MDPYNRRTKLPKKTQVPIPVTFENCPYKSSKAFRVQDRVRET